jgi:hypothetical protein
MSGIIMKEGVYIEYDQEKMISAANKKKKEGRKGAKATPHKEVECEEEGDEMYIDSKGRRGKGKGKGMDGTTACVD